MYHIRQLNIHPWKASLAQGPAVSWWLSRAIEASSLFVTQTSPVLDRIHKKRLRPLFVHLFILESLKVSRSHPRPYSTSWAGAPKLKIYFASVLSQNFGFPSWISHISNNISFVFIKTDHEFDKPHYVYSIQRWQPCYANLQRRGKEGNICQIFQTVAVRVAKSVRHCNVCSAYVFLLSSPFAET